MSSTANELAKASSGNDKSSTVTKKAPRRLLNKIPDSITNDPLLKQLAGHLPSNYNFEMPKTIYRIQILQEELEKKDLLIALQFPEGLLMYSCIISDIIQKLTGCETVIMGDVTYGACCIDDLGAQALNCDMIVHYGHSCLVPITKTVVKTLYVFVDIQIDIEHLVETIRFNFPDKTVPLALMGVIQFNSAVDIAREQLKSEYTFLSVPQAKPRSVGEVLGCTSPILEDKGTVIFIADGRFHMEAAMIRNPQYEFYQYNPYSKLLSIEKYDHKKMHELRLKAVEEAKSAQTVGIILGTLGRQGNPDILERLKSLLEEKNKKYFILLLSEVFPAKLQLFKEVDAWIQVACPRLSIDWGSFFTKPLLTPYEAFVTYEKTEWREQYPMDYYSNTNEPWTNYHSNKPVKTARKKDTSARKIEYEDASK